MENFMKMEFLAVKEILPINCLIFKGKRKISKQEFIFL
jgi:hypothetical protein